jgi:hypothetical protein
MHFARMASIIKILKLRFSQILLPVSLMKKITGSFPLSLSLSPAARSNCRVRNSWLTEPSFALSSSSLWSHLTAENAASQ